MKQIKQSITGFLFKQMIPLMFQVCAYVEEDMLICKSLPLKTMGAETFTLTIQEYEILGISVVVYTQCQSGSCS